MPRKLYTYGLKENEVLRLWGLFAPNHKAHHCKTISDLTYHLKVNADAIAIVVADGQFCGHVAASVRRAGAKNLLIALVTDCGADRSVLGPAMRQGADDAQSKDITADEFDLRLQILERRDGPYIEFRRFTVPNGSYAADQHTIHGGICDIHLTSQEDEILQLLVRRQGMVVSREMILNQLYGGLDEPEIKIIDVLICKVRKKLRLATGDSSVIETSWGRGYRWVPEKERQAPVEALAA